MHTHHMVSLGYGRFVRADRIFALVPIGDAQRGEGRRTYVHVEGLSEPIVASRSQRAILNDMETALSEAIGQPRPQFNESLPARPRRRLFGRGEQSAN